MSINVSYSKVNRSVKRPEFTAPEPEIVKEVIDSSDDPVILTLEDEYK